MVPSVWNRAYCSLACKLSHLRRPLEFLVLQSFKREIHGSFKKHELLLTWQKTGCLDRVRKVRCRTLEFELFPSLPLEKGFRWMWLASSSHKLTQPPVWQVWPSEQNLRDLSIIMYFAGKRVFFVKVLHFRRRWQRRYCSSLFLVLWWKGLARSDTVLSNLTK